MKKNILWMSAGLGAFLMLGGCSTAKKASYTDTDQIIQSNMPQFQKCYDQAVAQKRANDPSPNGRLEVEMTVSPAGTVTGVTVVSSESGNRKFEQCVQETLRRIKFPANSEGRLTQTTYPFDFKSPDQK
jgi:TonB family protein